MLNTIERLDKQHRKFEKYAGGAIELPEYPGSIYKTYRLCYPSYLAVPHLKPLRDLFERAKVNEPFRACVSFPRRAGKTETVIAGMVDRLMFDPAARLAYVTYSGSMAKKKSAKIRKLAQRLGVPIDPATRSKQDWMTGFADGGMWATSTGGAITGNGFDLEVFDDMLEGRDQAESVIERDRAWDFIKVDASPCLEPDGARILNGTRWHDDDPIGRAVSEGWQEINVPAIDPLGNSYWAKRWPLAKLLQIQTELGGPDGYDWCSVYMGNPRAKGERLFQDAQFAEMGLPPGPCRVGIGVDFAYSVKKKSDYSCAVVMAEIGGKYYVVHVYRAKVPEAEFRGEVGRLAELYQAQFVVGYVAATEQGNVTLLQHDGMPAFATRATQDKKVHALPTVAAWNLGRILLLRGKGWERDFCKEVQWFTGLSGKDDQVDALCTVYDALMQMAPIDWDYINSVAAVAPSPFMGLQN